MSKPMQPELLIDEHVYMHTHVHAYAPFLVSMAMSDIVYVCTYT